MNQERLADAVNHEPIVFADCTGNEIVVSLILSFIVSMVLGIIIGIVIGFIMVGIILGLFLTMGCTWAMLQYLSSIRNKYYESYLKERIFLHKLASGLFNLSLIDESARYSRGERKHG